jgi:hypothetical protein
MQSAASADAASSNIAATTRTWRRVLMKGEVKVYPSDGCLQQIPTRKTAAGG